MTTCRDPSNETNEYGPVTAADPKSEPRFREKWRLEIVTGAGDGPLSDGDGDDQGEVVTGLVTVRLGTGADATSGGQLNIGQSTTVRFQAAVAAAPASGSIENTAFIALAPASSPDFAYSVASNVATMPAFTGDCAQVCYAGNVVSPVLDASGQLIGSVRCTVASGEAPYCEEDADGVLVIFPQLGCTEVTPPNDCPAPQSQCDGTLATVGAGDFQIHFTVTTSATVHSALISQRSVCGDVGNWWDARMSAAGTVAIELSDGAGGYASLGSAVETPINDGQPHTIDITRVGGVMSIIIDCQLSTTGSVPGALNDATMPALLTGSGPCLGVDDTVDLVGTITDVCVSQGTP